MLIMTKEVLDEVTNLEITLSFSTIIDAVTQALKLANVKVVYNYPGRPASLLVENIKAKTLVEVQDYLPNEFVATAKGFGSSVAGSERSLVVFKDVGTNVACDHFYCLNHVGVNRGLVFFIADDPSAWYSQNEEDSRGIYFNAGLPVFEPTDPYSAYYCLLSAYELSEMYRLPFFIRATSRSLLEKFDPANNDYKNFKLPIAGDVVDIPFDALNKWKSIFSTVEEDKEELAEKQIQIRKRFETLNLNITRENGSLGIIASGFPATQLENEKLVDDVSLLKLVTLYPLPEKTIVDFIKDKERILVIDQGEPLLELLVRDCAQRNSYNKPILGKLDGFVRKIGEFRDDDLKVSVDAFRRNKHPGSFPKHKKIARPEAFYENDSYKVLLDCVRSAVKQVGIRPLYCADAGQTSRIPDTPGYEDLLHLETTMGCVSSYLSGGIEAYKRRGSKIPFKGIAYVGDSDFFHSAFSGICEAVAKNHPILMILVDNQGAVSTGKQPHLGMRINDSIYEISIRKVLEAIGVKHLEEAYTTNTKDLTKKIASGLKCNEFFALIVHTE